MSKRLIACVSLSVVAVVGLLVGCDPAASTTGPSRIAAHGVHSSDLGTAMKQMNQRTVEEIRTELYTGESASMDSGRVVASAKAVAQTGESLAGLVEKLEMTGEDRTAFVDLANKMISEAREVAARAEAGDRAAARAAMDRLNATCTACHDRFRF